MPLRGKAVVVSGGAKGIGRYIALGCAERGANVAVCDVDADALRNVAGELARFGTKTLAAKADVRNEEAVREFMAQAARELGTIDYLVNNAAIVPHFMWGGPRWPVVRDMDFAFWERVFATNLHGTFLCSKHAIPYMERQRSGHIVNLHGGGPTTPPGSMAYAITKEAGVVMARYLAEEVRSSNICVLSISPGAAIACEWAPDDARKRLPGPEYAGERFFIAIDAPMELSGHLVDLKDGALVPIG